MEIKERRLQDMQRNSITPTKEDGDALCMSKHSQAHPWTSTFTDAELKLHLGDRQTSA